MFIGSADWMERNLNKRIELMIPVLEAEPKHKLKVILEYNLRDNVKSRELNKDGRYEKVKTDQEPFNSQEELILRTNKKFKKYKKRLAKLKQD